MQKTRPSSAFLYLIDLFDCDEFCLVEIKNANVLGISPRCPIYSPLFLPVPQVKQHYFVSLEQQIDHFLLVDHQEGFDRFLEFVVGDGL